jgi:glycosyltransferase involved in cell wall biosynthesis
MKGLQKILILSYYYPPSNFVGGERIHAWARYLNCFGFYPIIITRKWNKGQKDLTDKVLNNTLEIEYCDTHEIHRLPYKSSIRDYCSNYTYLKVIQKALTLVELIFSNFFIRFIPFSNFYSYSHNVLAKNKDISILIASGRPFTSFHIAHKLKKKFPRLIWIPDYRDEWTSHQKYNKKGVLNKFIYYLESKSEIKWTSNAHSFISVSERLVTNIKNKIRKNGISIPNGYEINNPLPNVVKTEIKETITFAYLGTLYDYQPIERVVNAFKEIKKKSDIRLVLRFYGVELIPSVKEKLKVLISGHENNFILHDKVEKQSLPEIQQNSNFLFLTNYNDINDWLVVKLIDYSVTGVPVVLFPSDNGVMSNFINETNIGYAIKDEDEFFNFISEIIKNKQIEKSINMSMLNNYSSKKQIEKLGSFLVDF